MFECGKLPCFRGGEMCLGWWGNWGERENGACCLGLCCVALGCDKMSRWNSNYGLVRHELFEEYPVSHLARWSQGEQRSRGTGTGSRGEGTSAEQRRARALTAKNVDMFWIFAFGDSRRGTYIGFAPAVSERTTSSYRRDVVSRASIFRGLIAAQTRDREPRPGGLPQGGSIQPECTSYQAQCRAAPQERTFSISCLDTLNAS